MERLFELFEPCRGAKSSCAFMSINQYPSRMSPVPAALPQELLIYLCPLSYENLQACPIVHTVTGNNLLCYQRPGIPRMDSSPLRDPGVNYIPPKAVINEAELR
jgi:hypothetical protein